MKRTHGDQAQSSQKRVGSDGEAHAMSVDGIADMLADNKAKRRYSKRLNRNEMMKGADINARDSEGRAALKRTSSSAVTQCLIEAGASLDLDNNEGDVLLFRWDHNVDAGKRLVGKGVDTNARDSEGRTALYHAFEFDGNFKVVKRLLQSGTQLDVTDKCNLTPLSFGIQKILERWYHNGDMEGLLLETLSEFQENLGRITPKGLFQEIINALFCHFLGLGLNRKSRCSSSLIGKALSASVICAKRYDIDDKIAKDAEELMEVLEDEASSILKVCKLFLKLGANPNTADTKGNTSLSYAVLLPFSRDITTENAMGVCRLLMQHGSVTWRRNYEGETPILYLLSRYGQLPYPAADMCKFLFDAGSSANDTTNTGKCVYHFIIRSCQISLDNPNEANRKHMMTEIMKILKLLSSEPSVEASTVNIADRDMNTPLILWAALDNTIKIDWEEFHQHLISIFNIIHGCGAKLNNVNLQDESPLHLCRTWCAMKLLLDAGANPQVMDDKSNTPLIAQLKRLQHKESLVHVYPDVIHLESDQETFWRSAISYNLELWALKDCESVLRFLTRNEDFELADSFLKACSEDYLGRVGSSALFDVCKDTQNETYWKDNLVETLLKKGVSANTMSQKGETPLHLSCRSVIQAGSPGNVHHTIVQRLRMYGADPDIKDTTGVTCFEMATELPDLDATLRKHFDINEIPSLIPWNSKSERFKPVLAQVARRQQSEQVGFLHYHKESIGSGAFGVVHAGINSKDGREIAIKSIRKHHIARPEDRREIKNLIKLSDCEQVVSYLDFTEDKNLVYIILDLMEGNLDEYLDSAPDSKHDVKLCKDVVLGIQFLHQKGILHRDLKPGNILYKTNPLCLKIADFGLSSKSDFCYSQSTVMYTKAGTRCWMAPELLKGKSADEINHTEHSDMFACGCVLHCILTRKRHAFAPDDCTSKSTFEVQTETESNIMASKPSISDKVSAEASNLVSGMIGEDKDQRVTAADALHHPLFWSNIKKKQFVEAVGNQKEIALPRSKVTSLSVVETDLESSFAPYFTVTGPWNAVSVDISQIHYEMTSSPKSRKYDTKSCVELVRFIRNAYAHVSDVSHPTPFRTLLLEDFVFFDQFPWLVMEVYKAVTRAGWHRTRREVKAAIQIG